LEKGQRLTPYLPTLFLIVMVWCYRMVGRYEDALDANSILFDRARKGEFNLLWVHNFFASIYSMMGKIDKAKLHVAEMFKIDPNTSLEWNRRSVFFKNPEHHEPILDSLRRVGVPD